MTRVPLFFVPLVAAVALAAAGCGESTREKVVRATSQVEVAAERLSQNVGEDGWFRRGTADGTDPWSRPLEVSYRRVKGTETLTVWSSGPDGLPRTRDDVSSHAYHLDNEAVLAEIAAAKSKNRQLAVENYGASLTRGLVKGTVQGWKDRPPAGEGTGDKKK